MHPRLFPLCALCLLCAFVVNASAAPPTLTYLYPAGAQRGTTAEVAAAGSFDKWPVNVWASGKGVRVEPGKEKGKYSVKVAADAVPGVYWLRAYNPDGASPLRPFVVGTLPEITEKEPNDEPRKAQTLDSSAVVVNGQLAKPGDVDCFAVKLRKGQTLVASVEANHTLRSPMDGVLQVVSADGFVLDQNNDFHGLDPQLAFTAPQDGIYIARVFAFPATPDSSIRFSGAESYVYRLTLTTGGFVDYAEPLAVGPDTKTVEPKGWNIPAEAKSIPVGPVPTGETHLTLFHPKLANPFRVRVEQHPCYRPSGTPDKLTPPVSITSRIPASGKEAAFPVVGKKGKPLSIQVESRSLGLAVNPVIRVLDAEKKQIANAEPAKLGGDTALSFNSPAAGVYTITVSDLYAGGGPRHAFLLRILTPAPDYDLTVAADRFAVPPGKSLDIPVKVNRRNGFNKPVEVVAEGLPDGVKWEVKPPAGKPDSNTVTVSLTAGKAGVAGAFRLVGKVMGEPAIIRTASAALPEFEETTGDLWVTASDTPVANPPKKKKR